MQRSQPSTDHRPARLKSADRRAAWLLTDYDSNVWTVCDTGDDSRRCRINFHYRLADGRTLTECDSLLSSVKEYTWFLRDNAIGKVDTASTQMQGAYSCFAIVHWMTRHQIWSFSQLQERDIDELKAAALAGVDGLLNASVRVRKFIEKTYGKARERTEPEQFGSVVEYKIWRRDVIRACNLPDKAGLIGEVRSEFDKYRPASRREVHIDRESSGKPVLTKQTIQRLIQPVQILYNARYFAHCEVPPFNPFPGGTISFANQHGRTPVRTPVPPERQYLRLLEYAAVWVVRFSPAIVKVLESVPGESHVFAESNPMRPLPPGAVPAASEFPLSLLEDRNYFTFEDLPRVVPLLATACWILVAAFSARRYSETIEVTGGRLRGNAEDGWELSWTLLKPRRDRREWQPIPLIAARSVQTLEKISEPARLTAADSLFQWRNPSSEAVIGIDPRPLLKKFAELARDGDEPHWNWMPRQLRRAFAVFYFYRYRGADIAILSTFLGHFDIETTRGYVTFDPEIAVIWREVEEEYTRGLAEAMVSGELGVAGAMGERLRKFAALITRRLRRRLVVARAPISEGLYEAMKRSGLVITPKPWVDCCCPRTQRAAARARCRAGQVMGPEVVGPSFADAGPLVCKDCRWALLTPAGQAYVKGQLDHLQSVVGAGARTDTLFGAVEREQLVELRKVSEIQYKHFKAGDV
jgi:hypothetical protein